jgi:hypothetical protein
MPHVSRKIFVLSLTAACVALLLAGPAGALADPGNGHGRGQGHGRHKGQEAESSHADDKVTVGIRIDAGNREIIRDYIRRDSARGCPPGLAKKHNGCLPPGIAKKYAIGQKLKDGVSAEPLPGDLLALLAPAPAGYMYARVDKDVVLIAEATRKVVDAVTLLSAVGK